MNWYISECNYFIARINLYLQVEHHTASAKIIEQISGIAKTDKVTFDQFQKSMTKDSFFLPFLEQ